MVHDGGENQYSGPPGNVDDWDAEDWENFWSEPSEASLEAAAAYEEGEEQDFQEDGTLDWDGDVPYPLKPNVRRVVPPAEAQEPDWPLVEPPLEPRIPLSSLEEVELDERKFFKSPNSKLAARTARGFRREGLPERAIRFVIRARTLLGEKASEQDRAVMFTTVAASYSDLGRYQLALVCAERAMKLAPASFHACRAAGRATAKLGLTTRADAYFERALKLEAQQKLQSSSGPAWEKLNWSDCSRS